MKIRTRMWLASIALTICAVVPVLAGCGSLARGDALPTIAQSYRNVVEPVLIVGIGAEQDSGGITAERADELRGLVVTVGDILNGSGEVTNAATAWEILEPFAMAGIDRRIARGEIGPGVGASLKEVLRLFAARLVDYVDGQEPAVMILTPQQNAAVNAVVRR